MMNKCIKCGSYAFNLYKENIDQGAWCDVHYWQGRAHRAEFLAEQLAQQQEPVMIYHGRCTIDCGEHGHQDVEMLKMIPAGTKLYTSPPAAQQQSAERGEPKAYIHRQGNHWEVSERMLLDDEKARGWTEEPLYTSPPNVPTARASKPLTDEQKIAEALRRHGLTLIKTTSGYDVLKLGQIDAHGIKENT